MLFVKLAILFLVLTILFSLINRFIFSCLSSEEQLRFAIIPDYRPWYSIILGLIMVILYLGDIVCGLGAVVWILFIR